jgi:hypothetical protein
LRKHVDAVSYGNLISVCEGDVVLFSLTYNGDQI